MQSSMQMLRNYSQSVPFSRCTPQTQHFLNSSTIELLPKGAIVLNAARGSLVDDEALIAALKTGRIAAAGLDVYESEPNIHPAYRSLPNTFCYRIWERPRLRQKTEKNDIVRARFIVVLPAKTPIEELRFAAMPSHTLASILRQCEVCAGAKFAKKPGPA
jgi:hypothetical protein